MRMASAPNLVERITAVLEENPERPMCIHRLYEEVVANLMPGERDSMLGVTERAADEVVAQGFARKEFVSAISIGVHCEDCMYWSVQSKRQRLEEFGPAYESPAILNRMASHFRCHGL
jgi:hypothetical protein